ncbi:MAG: hypothetical protein AAFY60_02345, partial [Myxococcota bacterium]
WSGGQAVEIPRKTAWEISPLSEEDSKSILREAALEQAQTRPEKSDEQRSAPELDHAIADEHRRAMAARFQGTTSRKPRRWRRRFFVFMTLVVLLVGLGAGLIAFEGPWTEFIDPWVDREALIRTVTTTVTRWVDIVRKTLGL